MQDQTTLALQLEPGSFRRIRDGHAVGRALYERHYSARKNRNSKLFVGPGGKLLLLSYCNRALVVWRKCISDDGQHGINCAVFRNENKQLLSSALLLEAEAFAWARWPGERLFTYVNPACITSANPGYCFKMAGWQVCGASQKGLLVLEKYPVNNG
jgi:hypothetical protein